MIRSFSLAMIWGIFVATYSSVFICSPMLIYLGLRNEDADKAAGKTADGEDIATPDIDDEPAAIAAPAPTPAAAGESKPKPPAKLAPQRGGARRPSGRGGGSRPRPA